LGETTLKRTFEKFLDEAYQIYGPHPHGPSDAESIPLGKPYKNKNRAKTRADQLDQKIGGYRHKVVKVDEEFKDLTPEKEQRVKNRVGELARDIQVQGARYKELKNKPLSRLRPNIKKEQGKIAKSARKKGQLVQNASDALIRTSTSRSAKIQKQIQDLKRLTNEAKEPKPVQASLNKMSAAYSRKYPGTNLYAYERGSGDIRLNTIWIPPDKRAGGIGTRALKGLTKIADKSKKTISLTQAPDPGKKAALNRFYSRHGFKSNLGKNRDFSIGGTHIRQPKSIEEAKYEKYLSPQEKESVRNNRNFGNTRSADSATGMRRTFNRGGRGIKNIPGDKQNYDLPITSRYSKPEEVQKRIQYLKNNQNGRQFLMQVKGELEAKRAKRQAAVSNAANKIVKRLKKR